MLEFVQFGILNYKLELENQYFHKALLSTWSLNTTVWNLKLWIWTWTLMKKTMGERRKMLQLKEMAKPQQGPGRPHKKW